MTHFGTVDLHNSGIHLELNGLTVGQIKIPSDFVPYTFAPILGTHLLLAGDKLAEGMIVVIEDKMVRGNPERLSPEYPDRKNGFVPTEYDRASVEENSRWALVTDLQNDGNLISFTAIYADGTMRARRYNKSYKWAVLKEFEFVSVCSNCGFIHEDARTIADDPEKQPFYDLLDETAKFLGSFLFPEASSDEERINAVKESVSFFVDEVKDELKSIFTEADFDAEIPGDAYLPGESMDEYADRMRDEAEIRGEYEASEAAKIRQRQKDQEDLDALRAKLRGEPVPSAE